MNSISVLGAVCVIAGLTTGCVDDSPAAPGAGGSGGAGGLFGGTPMQPNPGGGDAGDSGGGSSGSEGGRCAAVPASTEPRIDNFEDGNSNLIVEPGRLGVWHIPVLEGTDTLSFAVEPGGANGTDFAAHVSITSSVLAGVSASLRFDQEGVACPYNASGYSGVAFYAKGTGTVNLGLQTSDAFSTEFGGTCDDTVEQCWDLHRKLIPLSADWEYHEVSWDLFSQAGWGKLFPFAPDHLFGVDFAVVPSATPVELWIDEIRFLP